MNIEENFTGPPPSSIRRRYNFDHKVVQNDYYENTPPRCSKGRDISITRIIPTSECIDTEEREPPLRNFSKGRVPFPN
jgi:hypothetical protein